jgi:two-component system, NarL family, sensor kinase
MPDALPWQDGTMDTCALWLSILAVSLISIWVASQRRRGRDQAALNLARLQDQNRELHDCHDQFLNLAGKMSDMVWIVSVGRRKTVFVNSAFEEITGRTCQSLYDKPDCRDLIHPDDRAHTLARLSRQALQKDESAVEFRIVRADDATRWVRCRPFLFLTAGESNRVGWIVEDITDLKHVRETLRRISLRLQQVQDDERRRIARELHDSTAQTLTALILNLTALNSSRAHWDRKSRHALDESLALASQCSREVRSLSYLLHPPLLDELGLISALRHFVGGLTQRGDIRVDLDVAPDFERLTPEFELGIFRVVQESLINIRRHSGSTTARVRILQAAGVVVLEVSDEGRGLPQEMVAPGVGLAGMQERVEQLGGWVEIESSSQGTTVRAFLPYRPLQS